MILIITAKLTNVDKNQVLSYLGCRTGNAPSEIVTGISTNSKELMKIAVPKLTYQIFSKNDIKDLLIGNDINTLLAESEKVVLFGATLGLSIERELTKLNRTDVGKAVIFDACASAAIENVCDNFCADLSKEHGYITERFSPGYGDFPFEVQKQLFEILNLSKNIGVTLNESLLMIPQKSVTAIIGLSNMPQNKDFTKCDTCSLFESCEFRKENKRCEMF